MYRNLKNGITALLLILAPGAALGQEVASAAGPTPPSPPGGDDQFPAAFIATRAELNDLLVGGGTTDDFETYVIADGSIENTFVFDLQDTTIVNGQGPGLVHDGAIYFSSRHLVWCGNGFNGSRTRTILADARSMAIAFDVRTQLMGVDVQAFEGFGDTANVRIFSTAGQLLGSTNLTLPDDGTPVFVGFRHDAGIGTVEFTNSSNNQSPLLNDHTYGVICASDGCNGEEQLSVRVRDKSCGCQVQAFVKQGTPGNAYGFKMPNDECLSAVANSRGKAKVKQCPSRGGKVFVTSCSLEARVRCP
ncbi:MAG: hypothetical protein FLDDKLPJ_02073 [Phycisphaerae bacterium]|nr:hypothetical protein [Phycisphaerae bacterium]